MNIAKYRKFLVALSGALATLALVSEGGVTGSQLVQVIIAALTAAGVYQLPNALSGETRGR